MDTYLLRNRQLLVGPQLVSTRIIVVPMTLSRMIDTKRDTPERVLEPFDDPKMNDNSEKLVNMCIFNVRFKHKLIHMHTWQSRSSNESERLYDTKTTKSMIDFVVYNERLQFSV